MNNTISISTQNLPLSAAQKCVAGNEDEYFQIVSFYIASASGNRPNSTGLTIQVDPRLTVVGVKGFNFYQYLLNNAGRVIATGREDIKSEADLGDNKFFVTTASNKVYTEDGYLYFLRVQFPQDVAVGDVFNITIDKTAEFKFEDANATNEERAAMNTWTKNNGVANGRITITE